MKAARGGCFCPHSVWGRGKGGYSLSRKENIPLTPPRERTMGGPLVPRHWQFVARITAHAAQCKCGVHGFAMNPCELLLLSTAPYYREARVTVARRQTACRMRHCCARRIAECPDRRELLRTSTRWAERQRMIEAEANRLAGPLAASEAMPHSAGSLPPCYRHSRLTIVRRGCKT